MKYIKTLWPLAIIGLFMFCHFTKFPYTFIIIIFFILIYTLISDNGLHVLGFKALRWNDLRVILVAFFSIEISMDFVVQPLLTFMTGEPADYTAFEFIKGDTEAYFRWLCLMWVSAAFGEELLFRSFIIGQLEKLQITDHRVQIFVSSVAFCLPHLYQGVTGLIVTFIFGCCFAWLFVRYQNLWINVLVHGLIDTLFLTLSYYGLLSFYN